MEAWPTFLPAPTVDYSFGEASNTQRTQMESGRFRQRRRFTAEQNQVPVIWIMTPYQLSMFRSWLKYKISQGSDTFTIDLEVGGEGETQNVEAKIVEGNFNAEHRDGKWAVTALLEVENPALISEATYDLLVETIQQPLDELEAAVDHFDTLLNHVMPGTFV